MKLVMAIMSKDDASVVMEALTEESFQVTRMASTGGFLKSGNTTLIIGVEDNKVNKVIDIVSRYSSKRKQLVANTTPTYFGSMSRMPFEVTVGGAIIFVLDVDRFEKV
ncbi:MAG: cyclic-di-AMP receptor [Clostridia bacterium]|nr:cyclic-di-AMP receptor [Clostridia bacterium]